MTGTLLNVLAILVCGVYGRIATQSPAASTQSAFKVLLGAFTVWTGLTTVWFSLHGPFLHGLGQIGIAVLALMLGNVTGKLLHFQHRLNRWGGFARDKFTTAVQQPGTVSVNEAFLSCTILFTTNPLGLFGALLEGTSGNWKILTIKAVMDGLSMLSFARVFGWGSLTSVIPMAALQGTVTLLAHGAAESLLNGPMLSALGVTGGLLVFTVSLVILDLKKVQLADYLPSLFYAPLLAWVLRD